MGVHCDIHLHKASNRHFVTGSSVSGVVRYSLDEDTIYTRITVSFKGIGYLFVQNMRNKEEADGLIKDTEVYVNEDIIILDDKKGTILPIGSYETQFHYQLPLNIPPTFDFVQNSGGYTVRCRIGYYLRIKFESPEGNKRFSRTINVSPGINPNLSVEPRIYDKQRKLLQLLRDSFVTLKATINNPVVSPGGQVDLVYEIFNDTNVHFKSVESKLIEVTSLPRGHYDLNLCDEIVTDINTAGVKSGETQTIDVGIPIPKDVNSIENSQLIAREYFVKITVYLPLPYRNVTLKVPLQIVGFIEESFLDVSEGETSSWEVVEEVDIVNSDEELQGNYS